MQPQFRDEIDIEKLKCLSYGLNRVERCRMRSGKSERSSVTKRLCENREEKRMRRKKMFRKLDKAKDNERKEEKGICRRKETKKRKERKREKGKECRRRREE